MKLLLVLIYLVFTPLSWAIPPKTCAGLLGSLLPSPRPARTPLQILEDFLPHFHRTGLLVRSREHPVSPFSMPTISNPNYLAGIIELPSGERFRIAYRINQSNEEYDYISYEGAVFQVVFRRNFLDEYSGRIARETTHRARAYTHAPLFNYRLAFIQSFQASFHYNQIEKILLSSNTRQVVIQKNQGQRYIVGLVSDALAGARWSWPLFRDEVLDVFLSKEENKIFLITSKGEMRIFDLGAGAPALWNPEFISRSQSAFAASIKGERRKRKIALVLGDKKTINIFKKSRFGHRKMWQNAFNIEIRSIKLSENADRLYILFENGDVDIVNFIANTPHAFLSSIHFSSGVKTIFPLKDGHLFAIQDDATLVLKSVYTDDTVWRNSQLQEDILQATHVEVQEINGEVGRLALKLYDEGINGTHSYRIYTNGTFTF